VKFTINVDTGGTFTDGLFVLGDQIEGVKVDTTPHDLTVGFTHCLEEGARRLGFKTPKDLLRETGTIRLSTTIARNTMTQGTGPKLGLIVSKGLEDSFYEEIVSAPLETILSKDMIGGIEEEIDSSGKVIRDVNEEDVIEAVRSLLMRGARSIVVSLSNSYVNPVHEGRVKEIIEREYPKYYLGGIPVFLSSEITIRPDGGLRANTALLNAYFHPDSAKYLRKAEANLRREGYRNPLLIVGSNGGVSRVTKTRAIDLYNSGPVAALMGAGSISKQYGIVNVIALDVGGTSTRMGLIAKGTPISNPEPEVFGIPISFPIMEMTDIGMGSSSVAKVDPDSNTVKVGLESASAVCYGSGGVEPTALDADIVLGYIDPDYFLGGRKKLNKEGAWKSIKERIADPLKLGVEEASLEIRERLTNMWAEEIQRAMKEKGHDLRDFVLFSFGGAGGLYCCGVGASLGVSRIYTFPYGSIFNAFGASNLDILHVEERLHKLVLQSGPDEYLTNFKAFNGIVEDMQRPVLRNMSGEGYGPENVIFDLELEMSDGKKLFSAVIRSPSLFLQREEDVKAICDAFTKEYAEARGTAAIPEGGIEVSTFRLKGTVPLPHCEFSTHEPVAESPGKALRGERAVYWKKEGFKRAKVYEHKLLECGNVCVGPAIIEAEDTTYLIPEGRKYTIDKYLNGMIEEV